MRKSLVALAAAGILSGCASASSAPTLQSGPDAEVTADGLYRVDNSVMQLAYMKPGWDLRGYTAMLIDPVTVAYKTDPGGRRRDPGGVGPQNFALSDTQMENFKSFFQEAVEDALTEDGGYRIAGNPGPDVLRITAELMDLIIAVPTQESASSTTRLARSAGAVTLVMEIRDSQSGEIIARVADRRDPSASGAGNMVRVSPQAVRADMRRLFESWATLLRERLDDLRAVEIDPDPAQ